MNKEMLEDLILTKKTEAMLVIDEIRHEYAFAAVNNSRTRFFEVRDALREAIWQAMQIEQEIREKYKYE